ncbi:MAG: sulfite exporter TauE/SafE family protein [Sphaerochaeta sp.]|nr:sulfite exporter TauE/SafE family protein [Sphaerochaeta sp.]
MIPVLLGGITVLATHALEAVTGFGCTVLALPFLSLLFGVPEAVATLTILAWLLAVYIVITNWRHIDFRQWALITALMLCGLPIGIFIFRTNGGEILHTLLAIFIILTSILQLLRLTRKVPPSGALSKPVSYLLLFAAGIVHGMFSSGGPLVVLYATAALPDKARFRATLCLLWTSLNTIIILTDVFGKHLTAPVLGRTALLVPFLIAGIVAGERIHHRVDAKTFSIIVFGMLLLTGLFMLVF